MATPDPLETPPHDPAAEPEGSAEKPAVAPSDAGSESHGESGDDESHGGDDSELSDGAAGEEEGAGKKKKRRKKRKKKTGVAAMSLGGDANDGAYHPPSLAALSTPPPPKSASIIPDDPASDEALFQEALTALETAAPPKAGQPEMVDLAGVPVSKGKAAALAAAMRGRSKERDAEWVVNLKGSRLRTAGARALFAAAAGGGGAGGEDAAEDVRFRELSLANCELNDDGVREAVVPLLKSQRSLRLLDLAGNKVSDAVVDELVDAVLAAGVLSLNLGFNNISEKGVRRIVDRLDAAWKAHEPAEAVVGSPMETGMYGSPLGLQREVSGLGVVALEMLEIEGNPVRFLALLDLETAARKAGVSVNLGDSLEFFDSPQTSQKLALPSPITADVGLMLSASTKVNSLDPKRRVPTTAESCSSSFPPPTTPLEDTLTPFDEFSLALNDADSHFAPQSNSPQMYPMGGMQPPPPPRTVTPPSVPEDYRTAAPTPIARASLFFIRGAFAGIPADAPTTTRAFQIGQTLPAVGAFAVKAVEALMLALHSPSCVNAYFDDAILELDVVATALHLCSVSLASNMLHNATLRIVKLCLDPARPALEHALFPKHRSNRSVTDTILRIYKRSTAPPPTRFHPHPDHSLCSSQHFAEMAEALQLAQAKTPALRLRLEADPSWRAFREAGGLDWTREKTERGGVGGEHPRVALAQQRMQQMAGQGAPRLFGSNFFSGFSLF